MANITENALDVLQRRYFINGETTPEQMFKRVAHCVAQAETTQELRDYWEKEFFASINDLDWLPNSPTLMNAGTNIKQYSACFVIPIDDSMDNIFDAYKYAALVSKSGGGTGFSFSKLRPKDDKVGSTNGIASGPISWMRIQDIATEQIKQGGKRRGANMGMLRIDHPDILDFIKCKDDGVSLTNFNLSVAITDEFMEAVENGTAFTLRFNGKPYKEVDARWLFNQIVEHAHKTGDPGVVFIDAVNRSNPTPHIGEIEATNPCLHKNTYLVTENGLEKISDLKSRIWNGVNFTDSKAWKTGIRKVYRIMTKSGYEYFATGDHKFQLSDGSWCETLELIGKNIKFDYSKKVWNGINPYHDIDYRILGFELGDGSYHKACKRMKYIYATQDKDQEVISIIEKEFNDQFDIIGDGKFVVNIPYGTVYANTFVGKIEDRIIPDWIMTLPEKEMKYFLQGLFSANGCNLKEYGKIQLVSINKEMLQHVQQMLLLFGIKSKLWYHNKAHDVEFGNGVYTCKQSCHLVISRKSYQKYLDEIGFIQSYKNGYNDNRKFKDEDNFETVILISELDEDEVWDFSEPLLNRGVTNGAIVHNCGEQPLLAFEACNLGSINLAKMVKNNEIDWDKLKSVVRIAVRFLDDVIDISEFPVQQVTDIVRGNRKIGLGIMGFADMLCMLGIPYNSVKAEQLAKKLMLFIQKTSHEYSTELGKEKGIYPNSNGDKKRNAALTTIAPTGTISFIADASGGCEPNFAMVFNRHSTSLNMDYTVIVPVLENKLKELGLYSDELIEKIKANKGQLSGIKEIPKEVQKVFVTAMEISPEWHIRIQAAFQQGVDSAVSKTVNMPSEATIDDVANVYKLAYQLGCKGVTIYRDCSKDSQVLTTGYSAPNNNQTKTEYVPIRPVMEEARSKRKKVKTGCGSIWLFLVNDDEGNLQEIFTQVSGGGCKANIENISRLVSLCFRANIDPETIMEQLSSPFCKTSFDNVKCRSCGDVIAKEIKKFIQQNTKIVEKPKQQEESKNEVKKECTHPRMIKSEGCMTCPDCGYSKCS